MCAGGEQTFIGCTGSGMPNTIPVKMFHSPESTRLAEREIDPWTASAIINGRRVPKSPKDPEISATGDLRKVDELFAWMWPILESAILVWN